MKIEKNLKVATLSRVPSRKATGKAKGSFFADKEIWPYSPKGVLRAQANKTACVPAVCRMLIFDRFPELEDDINFSESYLRHFLKTDAEGSLVADIPTVLRLAQIDDYVYRNDLSFDELHAAVTRGSAVVSVYKKATEAGHVLIVEEVTAEHIAVRDPLPDNQGSAYLVRHTDFLAVWLSPKTGRGIGVVVVE